MTQSVSADGQTTITGVLKSNIITAPQLSSSSDTTTGFSSTTGEADTWVSGSKVIAATSSGAAVTGNLSATGNLAITGTASITGSTTLGTETVTTSNITTLNVSGIITDSNTGYWLPPRGNTGARPGSPVTGAERYNTDTNQIEYWNGSSWQVIAGLFAPNFQIFTSGTSATYTTPTAGGNLPIYLRVRMVGSGGGTTAGTDTTWVTGGGTWQAVHGGAGTSGNGGAGGTGGTSGTGTQIRRISGQSGAISTGAGLGGSGGVSAFGGGAKQTNGTQFSPAANSGSGSSDNNNGGGGAGEYVEFIIVSPASNYTYTVGATGTNGSAGRIEVEAFWQ